MQGRTQNKKEEKMKEEEDEKEEYPEVNGPAQWHHGPQHRMVELAVAGWMGEWVSVFRRQLVETKKVHDGLFLCSVCTPV